MNEVHGRDRNSEACAPKSEWNRDRGNGRASTHFTSDGVIRGDQTDAVYHEMTTISRGLDGFSSIDRFSSRRWRSTIRQVYVSALCIGACNRRWIAQLRAQSVCGGSRSLGRAGRASGTSQTLLLISSFTILYDRWFFNLKLSYCAEFWIYRKVF